MSYQLLRTRAFDRSLRKFLDSHRDLHRRVAQVLRDLEADPYQPNLRLHALRGELARTQAARITYGYRITVSVDARSRVITLLDIGATTTCIGSDNSDPR